MVDRLGKAESVDASLKAALQEILNFEGKDIIESEAGLVEDTDTDKTANQGVTLEKTLGVLLVESEELTIKYRKLELQSPVFNTRQGPIYRAARRILDRVSWTRQTSRLLRRPYSPTIFNSESL